MGDFFQNGSIATLHNLGSRPTADLERELSNWSADRPMALVLPCLFAELEGPALGPILDQIAEVPYLDEVIIGLDRADKQQFEHAREFFGRLPQRHRLLWNDGVRMRQIDETLKDHGLSPAEAGKGRNVWYCLGYFLASGRAQLVALHDCDILTYHRRIVAQLLYPLAHPTFGYSFCKGYYFRVAEGRLRGRVARLLVTPLIRALSSTIGPSPYLRFIDSFRYPLAGEFALRDSAVRSVRIPSDWGLEIGVLSEIYRYYSPERVCQVDIAGNYDHKHQNLSASDPESGLNRMSTDIAKAFFRKLAIDGTVFSPEVFRTLKASYYRAALDLVDRYHNDAVINGLEIDHHEEESAVELFSQSIMRAGDQFLTNPMETPFIPSWSRVESAVPDVFERIVTAVEADNA
ncbi:MAG: glycosyl transferase [Thermoleophilia bacterium]|nr:glycosyl transferase [Thermoleophilia bacterium]